MDTDDDDDGIPDIIENGGVDANGDGVVDDFIDTDDDGWADTFDPDDGGTSLTPQDFDLDGIYNYRDTDSDNDGIADIVEVGNATADTDGDGRTNGTVGTNGLDNAFESVDDYTDPNGNINDPTTLLTTGPLWKPTRIFV